MKTIILFAALLLFSAAGLSQKRTADDILAQKEQSRQIYRLTTTMYDAIVVNMSYGQNELISETDRKKLAEVQVVGVDLVFSDFPKGEELKKLNKSRIEKIAGLRRDLVTNPDIQWKVIRQTACKNEAEAKVLFHGVVIHYRPTQGPETTLRDMTTLGELPSKGDSLKLLVNRERPYGVKLSDSTVIKALERNKEWKDMLIVADMTGSMSPYATQLLVWFQLKMKDKRVKQVVFFNDGNNKRDSEKIIGRTGGIYAAKAMTYEDILETATKTITNGGGGDGPENNCEALIYGIDTFPNVKEIIMVADNLAPVKDIALLKEIKKPVHIILCGTGTWPVNSDYLNLARSTGGTIHTMNDDIVNLAKLNEGETVKIAGTTFKITGGVFVRVTTL